MLALVATNFIVQNKPRTWTSILALQDPDIATLATLKNDFLRENHALKTPQVKKEPTDAESLGRTSANRRNMLLQDVAESTSALSAAKSIVNKLKVPSGNLSGGGTNYIPVKNYFEDAFKLRLQLELPFNGPEDLAVRDLFDHALLISAVETALIKAGRQQTNLSRLKLRNANYL